MIDNHPFLPFTLPDIGESEIEAVVETLRSGWLTSGPRVADFERDFRDYTKTTHALAVNSATAGLHLALEAAGIGPGDEVITTPLTFCATVNVILQCGATPVLADIGADLNLDPEAVQAAITPRTRALLPVHIAGLPCNMSALWNIARRHGLKVIEDAAHAAGSRYRGVPIGGGESDAAACSFYATKNLATGEGGMVTTHSAEMNDKMRTLCLHGIDKHAWNRYREVGSWFYEVTECGYKYNMSDIPAAIGIHQLRRLDQMNARRAEIAHAYNEAFSELEELFSLPPDRADSHHSWHLYILRLNLEKLVIGRDEFIQKLKELGIGCSVHFIPIPRHPYYRAHFPQPNSWERVEQEYPRLISLPIYSRMSDFDVARVINTVLEVADRHRKTLHFAIPGFEDTVSIETSRPHAETTH